MTDKPENPPAFPTLHIPDMSPPAWSGMSLRDYFAAAALKGFCANDKALKENAAKYFNEERPELPRQMLALTCYQVADAMLEASK